MNAQILEQARAAYRAGDFSTAAQMFRACKAPGEVCGEADHLRGNSLMRLGLFADAAQAYAAALGDAAYGKRGALLTNQGKALAAGGDAARAAECFRAAVQDAAYPTPYKAYMGLGQAMLAQGNPTDAGVAFRQAAIDGANPAPADALANLGSCFLAINRPDDAVEAYKTASDFAGPRDDRHKIDAGLGEALAHAGKHADAVDAFTRATADGTFQLSEEQQAVFQSASDALSAERAIAAPGPTGTGPYQPQQAQQNVDPLDPMGKSGSFIPDPSDTGFFTLTESEMVQQDRQKQKIRRKRHHTGLKIFLTLLVIVVLVGGGLAFAYTRGLGYPSQQDQISGLFLAVTDSKPTDEYLASDLSADAKAAIISAVPSNATPTIKAMDQGISTSTADVEVALDKGGKPEYTVEFTREGIGWKVKSLTMKLSDADAEATGTDASSTGDGAAATGTDATASQGADASGQAASGDAASGGSGASTDAGAQGTSNQGSTDSGQVAAA